MIDSYYMQMLAHCKKVIADEPASQAGFAGPDGVNISDEKDPATTADGSGKEKEEFAELTFARCRRLVQCQLLFGQIRCGLLLSIPI